MKSFVSSQKEHAVVLGGSFAGLMTAKVLSTRYQQVTIVEKDVVHRYPESRKGQPHTKHLHGLLPRGFQILCSYFPGFFEEIVANGGIVADFGDSMNWFAYGGFKKKVFMGLKAVSLSRPLLEHLVRERVLSLANVRLLDNTAAKALLTSDDKQRVTGVVAENKQTSMLTADLVVDCIR